MSVSPKASDQSLLVVIPTYLAQRAQNVETLSRAFAMGVQGSAVRVSVVVVANSHAARLALKDLGTNVEVLTSDRNLGFGGAINFAMGRRSSVHTCGVLIVNDDLVLDLEAATQITAECIKATVDGKRVGIVSFDSGPEDMPVVFSPSTVGTLLRVSNLWWLAGKVRRQTRSLQFEFYCAFVSQQAWLATDGFDEARFPLYFEDADLVRRTISQGLAVRRQHAEITHLGSATSRRLPGVVVLHAIGARSYLRRHSQVPTVFISVLARACLVIGSIVDVVRKNPRRARAEFALVYRRERHWNHELPPYRPQQGMDTSG